MFGGESIARSDGAHVLYGKGFTSLDISRGKEGATTYAGCRLGFGQLIGWFWSILFLGNQFRR